MKFSYCFSIPLLLLLCACSGSEPNYNYDNLIGKWYITYYPFYQSCDIGSWVRLDANGNCEALILCNDPNNTIQGTWSREGTLLILDCQLIEAMDKNCYITSLSETELNFNTKIYSLPVGIQLTK